MSRQYHYVVMFDTETKEFSVDVDTTIARFDDEPVFDTDKDAWVEIASPLDIANYYLVEDALARSVREMTPWA